MLLYYYISNSIIKYTDHLMYESLNPAVLLT